MVARGFDSGNYKSKAEQGIKIGLSGQWIGRLLEARRIRVEVEAISGVTFDDLGTEVILATRPLKNKNDVVQLLKLVQKKKIYSKDTEKVAKLCQSNESLKKKILYEGVSYQKVIAEFQNNVDKVTTKKVKTVTIENPQLSKEIYKTVSENINMYLLTLDDTGEKKTAINYLKMTAGVIAEALYHNEEITEEQFKRIRDDVLELYMDNLKDYQGESLDNNIGKWLNKSSQDNSEKEQEINEEETTGNKGKRLIGVNKETKYEI